MKIVVYAYLDNNLGDDLMIKILAQRFPQHQFYIYSNSSIIKHTFRVNENIIVRKTTDRKVDLETADAYLTIGGSLFQLVSAKQKYWRIKRLRQLRKIKRKNIKIATLGSNFGPYSGKFGIRLTEWELRQNDLVTVRDKEAEGFLRQFKKIENYHLADDIVYNLPMIYKSKRIDQSGLGISAYRSIREPEYNFDSYKILAAIADEYIRRTGKNVKLFAFDSENENDLSAAMHIFNFAEEKENFEIIPYLGDETYFLEQFEACERMIAIRFHSAILADIFKIPFLPVIYSNKMSNFLIDRAYVGPAFALKELSLMRDLDSLVDTIIKGEGLFNKFTGDEHNSDLHFVELEKIFDENLCAKDQNEVTFD